MTRSFWGFWNLGTRATSRWRPNATWRAPNATWRARFAPFLGVLVPLGWSHVVLEAQRDIAWTQCDVACSFAPFLSDLVPLGSCHVVLEAQRVMAGAQYDVARSFCSLSGGFGPLDLEPRRVGGPTRHDGLPTRHGALPIRRGRAQYNVTRLCLGTSTKKATSELSQRWQVQFLFGFLFA